jgi:hypothetical protein
VRTLQHWRLDSDLAKLPAEEQKAWGALWANVDALLQKAQGDGP